MKISLPLKPALMLRFVLVYGGMIGVLLFVLRLLAYSFSFSVVTIEQYVGAIAIIFVFVGIFVGKNLEQTKDRSPDLRCTYFSPHLSAKENWKYWN
jgi:uncharacterized metal-binding protein